LEKAPSPLRGRKSIIAHPCFLLANKLFLIVIHRFSLVKAKMNAPRICKLCNGVNKMPQFHKFSTAKGGTKTIAHLSIADG
jgi:hypothetical protein